MKQLFLIDDSMINKISYYHLACFLVALPFDYFYSEIILISFGLHTIIHLQKAALKNMLSIRVLILISVFLISLFGVFYSTDKAEGINTVTKQLAILIIPILFAINNLDIEKYRLNLVCIFGFTCTLTILYLFADALYNIDLLNLPLASLFSPRFMNHYFSGPIKLHATYLSMYVTFSLLVFLYLLLTNANLPNRWLYVFSSAILAAGMLQLSSRAVFIAFLVILNLVFPFFIYKGKKRIIFFITTCFISGTALLAINNMDSFKERYIRTLKTDLSITGSQQQLIEDAEPRITRWGAILELIKNSPVVGYGSGSEKELLKEKYFEKKMFVAYLNEFNAHNEYLSFLIKTGIIGLALFIYVLYRGYSDALKKKDILFLSFLVLISIVFISENMLDLNKGIFFYSFFFSLFFVNNKVSKG